MNTSKVRAALLRWYDGAARDLPWRRTRDPYAIWVSEVMLQQTRVQTVIDYYERFLTRFPTTHALADASEDSVMAAWSGLGYYRRARLLHAGVREVVARYGGQVPEAQEARRALPGVGRYTAGAIGSIAFGKEEPVVDGNVARVFSRLYVIETPIDGKEAQRQLWREAEKLACGSRPGCLNQALMELGATLCRKTDPDCERCPVHSHCAAHARGIAGELPVVRKKKLPRKVALVALLAVSGRADATKLWLCQGQGSLFAGLWNLPMAAGRGAQSAQSLLETSGLRGRLEEKPVAELSHVLTHRKLQVQLWRVKGARGVARDDLRAVRFLELGAQGISTLTRKALLEAERRTS